jgi:hypothetical protein
MFCASSALLYLLLQLRFWGVFLTFGGISWGKGQDDRHIIELPYYVRYLLNEKDKELGRCGSKQGVSLY